MRGENETSPQAASVDASDAGPPLVPGRTCGACSLCCKLNPVAELGKPAGQWCVHSVRGGGCGAYADRPATCRQFFCAWRRDPSLGPEWRPDVSRFVLAPDPSSRALLVAVDPGMPHAWRRQPYYDALKRMSEQAFRQGMKVLVNLRGHITVILPDRDVSLGQVAPGEEIVIWREGLAYAAARRQDLATAQPSGQAAPRSAPAPADGPAPAALPEGPERMRELFREAFGHASELLNDPGFDARTALAAIMSRRNRILDETADAYAKAGRAECGPGCTSCCYLMVRATPWEIFAIARNLLETRAAAEIEAIKQRLQAVATIPRDPLARVRARVPCGLLEDDGRCAAYGERPSVCRMTLSQSRAACDSCLQAAGGLIPYIEHPSRIAAVIQAGIDYALVERRNLSVEGVELSRALLVALDDCAGAMTRWLSGEDPFPEARFTPAGSGSDRERAISAAARFGFG